MMKKRAFVVSMGLLAMLGVGACSIDSNLISDLVGDLTGGFNFGSDDSSVALACYVFSAQEIEDGRMAMQDFRNEGSSYNDAIAMIPDGCQEPDAPGPLEDCIACGNAIAAEVYGGF